MVEKFKSKRRADKMTSPMGDEEQLQFDDEVSPKKSSPINASNFRKLLPHGTVLLESQVSGHKFDLDKNRIGMLKDTNGRVFKPIDKPALGEREIAFYENLKVSGNPTDGELKRFAPAYYGTKEMKVLDKTVKFIELEDVTDGMAEPCVMDVKIGRRTWDGLASPEKRAAEDRKYAATKEAYGFCIPGFQVYKLPTGELQKYDKDYGKKLNEDSLVEALEIFLNGNKDRGPCRDLVLRLVSILWKILALFRDQRRYRFYSSSLLLVYDAKRLRHHLHRQLNNSPVESLLRSPISRGKSFCGSPVGRSLGSLNHLGKTAPMPSPQSSRVFSFQIPGSPKLEQTTRFHSSLTRSPRSGSPARSPMLSTFDRIRGITRSISLQNCENYPDKIVSPETKDAALSRMDVPSPQQRPEVQVPKLCRTHSYSNNFENDLMEMKEDYAAVLSELCSSCEEKQNWVRVYMIDFAHVFPILDSEHDTNYLEGIENLIKLLERFL
ncbi:uncharacterized protein LOC106659782 isoform X1 [Trichogramma pretiosum]|uniref:uncharacterized protein LOC106659782 isoform X1 n=2 Tax=Trichogramma pretiosum TaxID=7493 RepID=UPI0006C98149|nr:uncharacterized protein LOC106659782 isoform X1 [Trichogramma pretiosum]